MTVSTNDVAIVGAGPYGLATAAHLQSANLRTVVLGEAMEFWQEQMPAGMKLRSSWEASHISDPRHRFTLDGYEKTLGTRLQKPVPLDDFVRYGKWFQQQIVPDLDRRKIKLIERASNGYRLYTSDGEQIQARQAVVATGISKFAYRPPQFQGLPQSLVSHSSEQRNLGQFSGKKLAVIGGGQSAIESAALAHEWGAEVEVIMRAPHLIWLGRGSVLRHSPKYIRYVFYPPSDVGPPGLNWIVALPDVFRKFPTDLQQRIAYRSIRPAASSWLRSRVDGIEITTERQVVNARAHNGGIRLILNDGTESYADHVLLATGYRVDLSRLDFLDMQMLNALKCVNGYPLLTNGLESSIPGLYFAGAPAALSFGPLMRFVAGSEYAASRVTQRILKEMPVRYHPVGDRLEAEQDSRGKQFSQGK